MPFRILFTGIFTGSLAAAFAFTQENGMVLAILAYAIFGVMTLLGFGLLTHAAPKRPVAAQTPNQDQPSSRHWHALVWPQQSQGIGWQNRLERMARQTTPPVNVCVFSSVRRQP